MIQMTGRYKRGKKSEYNGSDHRLRTPNEGINQSYLKNWADMADKICFGQTSLGIRTPGFES